MTITWRPSTPLLVTCALVIVAALIGVVVYAIDGFDPDAWSAGDPAFMSAQIAYAFTGLFLAFLEVTVILALVRRRAGRSG